MRDRHFLLDYRIEFGANQAGTRRNAARPESRAGRTLLVERLGRSISNVAESSSVESNTE
jgi:hypothetical protein